MKIDACHWRRIEEFLASDDRCVIPLGCTEQHAFLSLATDSILAERVAVEAADPIGVPVFPVLAYGITPSFAAYPGTVSLRVETYGRILQDLLSTLHRQGFRRLMFVNGHGGNTPGRASVMEWMLDHAGAQIKWHDWWNAPQTMQAVTSIDPVASHASWMENFPWTRLEGVESPREQKPMTDLSLLRTLEPVKVREVLGDGNFGGYYQRSEPEMRQIWQVAVMETRFHIENW